jgi:hypothetical protein
VLPRRTETDNGNVSHETNMNFRPRPCVSLVSSGSSQPPVASVSVNSWPEWEKRLCLSRREFHVNAGNLSRLTLALHWPTGSRTLSLRGYVSPTELFSMPQYVAKFFFCSTVIATHSGQNENSGRGQCFFSRNSLRTSSFGIISTLRYSTWNSQWIGDWGLEPKNC